MLITISDVVDLYSAEYQLLVLVTPWLDSAEYQL